ncbi:unnamed protein product, partial [Pleuronectes platessa]
LRDKDTSTAARGQTRGRVKRRGQTRTKSKKKKKRQTKRESYCNCQGNIITSLQNLNDGQIQFWRRKRRRTESIQNDRQDFSLCCDTDWATIK